MVYQKKKRDNNIPRPKFSISNFFENNYFNNNETVDELIQLLNSEDINSKSTLYLLIANSGMGKTRFCIELVEKLISEFSKYQMCPIFLTYNCTSATTIRDKDFEIDVDLGLIAFLSRIFYDITYVNIRDFKYLDLIQDLFLMLLKSNKYTLRIEDIKSLVHDLYKSNKLVIVVDELIKIRPKESTSIEKFNSFVEQIRRLSSNTTRIFITSLQLKQFTQMVFEPRTDSDRKLQLVCLKNMNDFVASKDFDTLKPDLQSWILLTGAHSRTIDNIYFECKEKEMDVNSNNSDIFEKIKRIATLMHYNNVKDLVTAKNLIKYIFKDFNINFQEKLSFFYDGILLGSMEDVSIVDTSVNLLKLYYDLKEPDFEINMSIDLKTNYINLINDYISMLSGTTVDFTELFEKTITVLIYLFSINFENLLSMPLIGEDGLFQNKHTTRELNITKQNKLYSYCNTKIVTTEHKDDYIQHLGGNNPGYDSRIETNTDSVKIEYKSVERSSTSFTYGEKEFLGDIISKMNLCKFDSLKKNSFILITNKKVSVERNGINYEYKTDQISVDVYIIDILDMISSFTTNSLKFFLMGIMNTKFLQQWRAKQNINSKNRETNHIVRPVNIIDRFNELNFIKKPETKQSESTNNTIIEKVNQNNNLILKEEDQNKNLIDLNKSNHSPINKS